MKFSITDTELKLRISEAQASRIFSNDVKTLNAGGYENYIPKNFEIEIEIHLKALVNEQLCLAEETKKGKKS